jgi:hypothetical protein
LGFVRQNNDSAAPVFGYTKVIVLASPEQYLPVPTLLVRMLDLAVRIAFQPVDQVFHDNEFCCTPFAAQQRTALERNGHSLRIVHVLGLLSVAVLERAVLVAQ